MSKLRRAGVDLRGIQLNVHESKLEVRWREVGVRVLRVELLGRVRPAPALREGGRGRVQSHNATRHTLRTWGAGWSGEAKGST